MRDALGKEARDPSKSQACDVVRATGRRVSDMLPALLRGADGCRRATLILSRPTSASVCGVTNMTFCTLRGAQVGSSVSSAGRIKRQHWKPLTTAPPRLLAHHLDRSSIHLHHTERTHQPAQQILLPCSSPQSFKLVRIVPKSVERAAGRASKTLPAISVPRSNVSRARPNGATRRSLGTMSRKSTTWLPLLERCPSRRMSWTSNVANASASPLPSGRCPSNRIEEERRAQRFESKLQGVSDPQRNNGIE